MSSWLGFPDAVFLFADGFSIGYFLRSFAYTIMLSSVGVISNKYSLPGFLIVRLRSFFLWNVGKY